MRRTQTGVSLIELVIGMAILSALMVGVASVMRSQAQSKQNAVAARQLVEFTDASEAYVRANYTTIMASAGATTPVVVGVPQLQAAGMLPASYPATNVFGQTPTARARKQSATSLETLVVHTGGVALADKDLDEIASYASQGGVAAGSVASIDTTRAIGVLGSWSLPLSNFNVAPGAGRIAANLSYTSEATNDTALHRQAIPGRPDLNRMSTAIDMAGNDLNSANNVNANKVNLPAGNSLQVGSVYYYGDSANSAIRQAGGLYIQTHTGGSAPISQVGNISSQGTVAGVNVSASSTVWSGGNVSASADLTGNRSFVNESYAAGWFRTQGDTGWYSEKWGGGWHMSDGTWIRAYGGKNVYSPGEMRANRMSTEGRMTAGEFVQLSAWAGRGGWCDSNGLLSREGDGSLLFCKNNVWTPAGGVTTGSYAFHGDFTWAQVFNNNSAFTSFVTISTQANACSRNGYSLLLYVNGAFIGSVHNGHPDYAKVGHTTFAVPAWGNWQITPQWTGTCNTRYSVWQYIQS